MPIPTDSDAWQNGEEPVRLHSKILDFLKQHPDTAFHKREIADELTHTEWEASRETERLKQDLTEEEFEQRLYNDDLPDSHLTLHHNALEMPYVEMALSKLIEEKKVYYRKVDADAFDLPYDWETVTAFSHKG
jgi:hypothetical protein